ncbi:uncharacterized protein LOC126816193 [Patella vulgata]|uniref:uncharacterized protein LOC126816193 n=1 Tax=Patella vulgata TaxID=6465 RepID=UPI00217FC1FF|nr:uncharacterized protein LOC126816193 [Patella vulgata]
MSPLGRAETSDSTEPSVEPEPEREPEPEVEPEVTVEPEVEPEVESRYVEPEVEPGYVEPETVAELWPEPGPNWTESYTEWGEAWPIHVYLFALAYLAIALFGIFLIITIVFNRSGTPINKTTIALNSMITFFAITRSVTLFLDPYSSERSVPFMVSHVIWSIGIPGLTSSFSIVLLILLDTTKMEVAPPRFQKLSVIAFITAVHMLIVISFDILVMLYGSTVKVLLIICQLLFVTYGLVVSVGFLYVGVKIRKNLSASTSSSKDPTSKRLQRLTKSIFISSAVALSIAVTNLYAAVDIFGVFSPIMVVDSWSWWILQTCLRVEETMASILVLSVFIKVSPTETLRGFVYKMCCTLSRPNSIAPSTRETLFCTQSEEISKTVGWTNG